MKNSITAWFRFFSVGGSLLLLGLMSVPSIAQRTLVREFQTAAVLFTTGDTVQGAVRMHCNEDLLEFRRPGQAVLLLPASAVRIFTAASEAGNQPYQQSAEPKPALTSQQTNPVGYKNEQNMPQFLPAGNNSFVTPAAAPIPESAGGVPLYILQEQKRMKGSTTERHYRYSPSSSQVTIFRTYRLRKEETSVGAPAFFEQLTDGPVQLLRRQELYNHMHDVLYIAQPDSTKMPTAMLLRHPRRQLLACFASYNKQLKQYEQVNRTQFTDAQSVAAFVTYANSLLEAPQGDFLQK